MLVFNMFNKKDEMCVCFERYFLAMGNSLEDFWSINKKYMQGFSREEDEEYIGKCKKVLIVMSKEYMTDMLSLYYMDVIRSLKEQGVIEVMAMIGNDVNLPSRYEWINDADVSRIAFYNICLHLCSRISIINFV